MVYLYKSVHFLKTNSLKNKHNKRTWYTINSAFYAQIMNKLINIASPFHLIITMSPLYLWAIFLRVLHIYDPLQYSLKHQLDGVW